MTPPAGWVHGSVASTLVHLLSRHVRAERLGLVFESSVGYDLPSGETVEPDVSYVSAQRFAAQRPATPNQFLRAVPNLVVEVLSPSTAKRDRTEKKEIYARNSVEEYWIVDPSRRTVTVFRLGKRGYCPSRTYARGIVRSRVLPNLRLVVADLFTQ